MLSSRFLNLGNFAKTCQDLDFDHGPLFLRDLLNINRCLRQHTETPLMFDLLSSTTVIVVEDEIKNQTLNCKISGDHQIQILRSVGHLGPGRTSRRGDITGLRWPPRPSGTYSNGHQPSETNPKMLSAI